MLRQVAGLFVLQGLDLATTYHGLGLGAVEQNPVGVLLLGSGFTGLVLAKLAGTLLIVGAASWLWAGTARNQWQARAALALCCGLMVGVVGWNAAVLLMR